MRRETTQVEGQAPVEVVYFSPREAQILQAICEGLTNKEIATRHGLSVATVQQYVSELLRGLKLRSRQKVCTWAAQRDFCFLSDQPVAAALHPVGCTCSGIYCTAMRAASRPAAIDPAA